MSSESQAESQFDHIAALMQAINAVSESGETIEFDGEADCDADRLNDIAYETPLEVSVRSGWVPPMDVPFKAEEYLILLCTGGPAVRVVGRLDHYGQPYTATIEHQDWGTCWTALYLDSDQEDTLLRYAQMFYYGE